MDPLPLPLPYQKEFISFCLPKLMKCLSSFLDPSLTLLIPSSSSLTCFETKSDSLMDPNPILSLTPLFTSSFLDFLTQYHLNSNQSSSRPYSSFLHLHSLFICQHSSEELSSSLPMLSTFSCLLLFHLSAFQFDFLFLLLHDGYALFKQQALHDSSTCSSFTSTSISPTSSSSSSYTSSSFINSMVLILLELSTEFGSSLLKDKKDVVLLDKDKFSSEAISPTQLAPDMILFPPHLNTPLNSKDSLLSMTTMMSKLNSLDDALSSSHTSIIEKGNEEDFSVTSALSVEGHKKEKESLSSTHPSSLLSSSYHHSTDPDLHYACRLLYKLICYLSSHLYVLPTSILRTSSQLLASHHDVMYAIEVFLLFKAEWSISDIQRVLTLCLSKHPLDTTYALSLLSDYIHAPHPTEAEKQAIISFYQLSSLQVKWNDMYTRYALTRLSILDVQRLRELDVAMMRLAVQYQQHNFAWHIYEQSKSYSIYMCRVAMFVCKDYIQTCRSMLSSTTTTITTTTTTTSSSSDSDEDTSILVWQARASAVLHKLITLPRLCRSPTYYCIQDYLSSFTLGSQVLWLKLFQLLQCLTSSSVSLDVLVYVHVPILRTIVQQAMNSSELCCTNWLHTFLVFKDQIPVCKRPKECEVLVLKLHSILIEKNIPFFELLLSLLLQLDIHRHVEPIFIDLYSNILHYSSSLLFSSTWSSTTLPENRIEACIRLIQLHTSSSSFPKKSSSKPSSGNSSVSHQKLTSNSGSTLSPPLPTFAFPTSVRRVSLVRKNFKFF